MRIEAVTVCKGFGDILEHTIIHNQSLFDRWVIVTSPDDDATHRVCKRYGIDFVDTDAFTRKGEKFNKALGINAGLAHLTCSDWILHLDADILLPPRTRHFLENAELDTRSIHGIDRFDLTGEEPIKAYKASNYAQYEWFCLVNPPPNTTWATRLVHYDYGGWMPIGFFQLWHADSGFTRYPTKANTTAEHTDVLHAMRWPRAQRILIPEILAVHISSEKARWGANWEQRVTKPLSPELSPVAASASAAAAPQSAARRHAHEPPASYCHCHCYCHDHHHRRHHHEHHHHEH